MEKIYGTSAHISFHFFTDKQLDSQYDCMDFEGCYCKIGYFSGGENYENFIKLFNSKELATEFLKLGFNTSIIVYGEAYGGCQQGTSYTYGKELKFIAFDVKIGEHCWLSVPKAEEICKQFNIEFVDYKRISTTLEEIDKERDKPSTQAIRNGIKEDKIREGIVLRPLIELRKNNGARIIAKYKREEFRETLKKRKVISPEKQKIWKEAKETAEEWTTIMRLNHVLNKIKDHDSTKLRVIIKAMIDDIKREGEGEIFWNKDIQKAIGKKTANLYKQTYCNLNK